MSTITGTPTNFDRLVQSGGILTENTSYTSKKAYDFKWCEDCARYIDSLYSPGLHQERNEKLKINYNLANGRGDALLEVGNQFNIQKIEGESLSSGTSPIRHIPEITNVYAALTGELMKASLKFTAVDSSGYSTTMRQKKRLELTQQWIKQNIISPVEQQVAMQVMIENGVKDQSSLSPEDQQDLFSDIENRTKFRLIEDIDNYMSNDYRTPVETEVQKMVEWLVRKCDIKYVTDENFKNVIVTGSEIYRVGIRNNDIFTEIVDQFGFWKYSSKNKLFVEHSDIIQYRQHLTYTDIMTWHGTELMKGKYKDQLNTLRFGSNSDSGRADLNRILSSDTGPFLIREAPPINTEEGQRFQKMLVTVFGGNTGQGSTLNYTNYVWKSFGKLKAIKRKTNQGIQVFYLGENYEFNPLKGDIEESIEVVPEIYSTTRIGNNIFVDKGPLEYMYRSRENPFDVKMNYIGALYNTIGGNTENLAPIDLGKPYQHKINMQVAKIEELDRKNYGTPLAFSPKMKPKKTSWAEWFSLLKNEGLILHDDTSEGMTANDLQSLRGIPLSNINELQARQAYVEYLTNKMSMVMGLNPSRLGVQDPNTSVTNNRQNIVQSTIQTEYLYRTHNKVVENLINTLVNIGKVVLKDNPVRASYILDDMSIAELSLDPDLIDIAEQNIRVTNSIDDQRNLDAIRALAQPYIQNGMIDFEDSVRLMFAKNGAEMINTALNSKRKSEARMQQQQEMQNQQIQQQQQFEQQLEQMRQQMDMEKQQRDLDNKVIVAQLRSMEIANSLDIDKDGMNDLYETTIKKLDFEREKLQKEMEDRKKQREQDKKLKLEEIAVKRIAANKKPSGK
jgi:hypothetical protein